MVAEISTKEELELYVTKAGPRPVVIDWYMTHCGPCKRVAPEIERLSKKYAGKAMFFKINNSRCPPGLLRQHNIRGFPTFSFFHRGKKVLQFSGADARRVEATVDSLLEGKAVGNGGANGGNPGGNGGAADDGGAFTPDQIQYFIDAGIIEEIWSDDEEEEEEAPSARVGGAESLRVSCPICRKMMSKRELVHHIAACELLYQRCNICHEMYERANEKKHFEEDHKLISCHCGLQIMACKMQGHYARCATRAECMYCTTPIRMRFIESHSLKCGCRIERCAECGNKDTVKNIVERIHVCPPPCRYCGERVERKLTAAHEASKCPHRPVKCAKCGKTIKAFEKEYHEKQCKGDKKRQDGKRSGNRRNNNNNNNSSSNNNNNGGNKPSGGFDVKSSTFKKKEWSCPTCTLKNPNTKSTCQMCSTPKPASGGSQATGARSIHQEKIKQIMDTTGCTEYKAQTLLRQSNNDVNKAVNRFFGGS